MTSKPVAMLLADLGVTKSHSRPKVSNDNPYSESQFKTHRAERRPPCPEGRRRRGSTAAGRARRRFLPGGLGDTPPAVDKIGRLGRIRKGVIARSGWRPA
jgi:hypothetical protein